jgi:hypothetical protein
MTDTFQTAYDEKVREVAALNQMLHTMQALVAYLLDEFLIDADEEGLVLVDGAKLTRLATVDYNNGEYTIR